MLIYQKIICHHGWEIVGKHHFQVILCNFMFQFYVWWIHYEFHYCIHTLVHGHTLQHINNTVYSVCIRRMMHFYRYIIDMLLFNNQSIHTSFSFPLIPSNFTVYPITLWEKSYYTLYTYILQRHSNCIFQIVCFYGV